MNNFLKSDAVWRSFLYNLKDYAIVILDRDGHVVTWNEGARTLKGYEADEAIGMHFSNFYTPEARAVSHPERELAIAEAIGQYDEEGWRVRKDNTRFWAHVVITAIYDDNHTVCGFGKVVRDFTAHKQATEQNTNIMNLLELTARTDYLTGLDNRRSFDKTLFSAISTARRHTGAVSLAMVDLDRFKKYNDESGHLAGDSYLKQAAELWRRSLRPEDFIARYGGEEFVVVLADTALNNAKICMERLRNATPLPLTCSVGLAQWDGIETPDQFIGRADQALYQAKEGGRNCTVTAPYQDSNCPIPGAGL